MNISAKSLLISGIIIGGFAALPATTIAEIQCPMGWAKELHGVAEVCVAQNQNQNQAQVQNNNQNQNVNQNVVATGGSSSSSSSSSSDTNITINNPTATPIAIAAPQVVYTAPTKITQLPKTGLPEAALALTALLPAGFALKKFAFKKSNQQEESASSIWLEKQSSH
jgi:hypothetical protein